LANVTGEQQLGVADLEAGDGALEVDRRPRAVDLVLGVVGPLQELPVDVDVGGGRVGA